MALLRTLQGGLLAGTAAFAVTLSAAPARGEPAPAEVERQLADVVHELDVIVEAFNVAQGRLQGTTAQLQAVAGQLAPLESAAEVAQERVGMLAAGAYRTGGMASVSALLSADSPGTVMDQLTLLDHFRTERSREVSALLVARDRYRDEQRTLTGLADRQRAEAGELERQRAVIEARISRLHELEAGAARAARAPRASRAQPAAPDRSARRPAPSDRSTPNPEVSDPYVPVSGSDVGSAAVRFAQAQIGKPYRYGAEGPDTFDCSGLTMKAWHSAGVGLPHSAAQQKRAMRAVTRDQLRPGDLVFYFGDVHHVALYAGGGRVIDAPRTGRRIAMRGMEFAPIVGYGRPR